MPVTARMFPNSVRDFAVSASFSQVNAIWDFTIAVGGAATAPATYADLAHPITFGTSQFTVLDVHRDADAARISVLFSCPAMDASLNGLPTWVCLFREPSPISSSVVAGSAGPFIQGFS